MYLSSFISKYCQNASVLKYCQNTHNHFVPEYCQCVQAVNKIYILKLLQKCPKCFIRNIDKMHTIIWFWKTVGNSEILFFALKYYQTGCNASILPPKMLIIFLFFNIARNILMPFIWNMQKCSKCIYFEILPKKPIIMCAFNANKVSILKNCWNVHRACPKYP